MEQWPQILGDPLDIAYSGQEESSVIRTEFESGTIRQRNRFTASRSVYSVQWSFKDWQFALFRSFVRHSLHNGADKFVAPLWFGDGIESANVFIQDGNYSHSYISGRYMVSAQLVVENSPCLSASDLAEILELGEDIDALLASIDSFHSFIHETLPSTLP